MKVNGCGACSGIMKYIPVPHARFFKKECNIHDIQYSIGGTESERKQSDIELYQNMVKHSIEYFNDRVGSQFWFICWALMYYRAVRWFGKTRFNYTTI